MCTYLLVLSIYVSGANLQYPSKQYLPIYVSVCIPTDLHPPKQPPIGVEFLRRENSDVCWKCHRKYRIAGRIEDICARIWNSRVSYIEILSNIAVTRMQNTLNSAR